MLSSREWRVLALLVLSGFINYIDRSNLSIGATEIQSEMHLTDLDLGKLFGAFYWTYALFQLLVIAGWLVDRFNVCWVLAGGFFLWSGAMGSTGMARSFVVLFSLRLLLGMGESIAYPSYSRILANHFPEHHRGLANAMIDAGTKSGPALGALVGAYLIHEYGWRTSFVALGFGSLLWLIPWLLWMPRGKGVSAREDPAGIPSVFEIFRHRSALWSAMGLFCSNYFWYFLLTWLPPYLEKERHFPKAKMAIFVSLSLFCVAFSCIISGWLSDRLIARGGSPTRVRKAFAGTGLSLATIVMGVGVAQDWRVAMGLLLASCLAYGIFTSNLFAITQTLAGPRASGKWTGVQNGFGNLAGVAAPWLTGSVVQKTGEFYLAFVVAAAVALAGAGIFVFGIGRIEQVRFRVGPASPQPGLVTPQ
jgi:ACS family D-galactonate transporter-like MFS transporter